MAKTIPGSIVISNSNATVIFGISMLLNGIVYFFWTKQIRMLLPGFLPFGFFWVYLAGIAFVLGGIAISINRRITRLASYLVALLVFCIAIGIDLRGAFNSVDDLKFFFLQSLFKDGGLIAGALIIANFEREEKHRHRHRSSRSGSSRSESSGNTPLV